MVLGAKPLPPPGDVEAAGSLRRNAVWSPCLGLTTAHRCEGSHWWELGVEVGCDCQNETPSAAASAFHHPHLEN